MATCQQKLRLMTICKPMTSREEARLIGIDGRPERRDTAREVAETPSPGRFLCGHDLTIEAIVAKIGRCRPLDLLDQRERARIDSLTDIHAEHPL